MVEAMLLISAVLAWIAFLLAMNICNYFWQALVTAGAVFAATFITAYFELWIPFIIIVALLMLVLLILTIEKSINKRK